MVLKDTHDKIDEIPSEYRSLYTERNGKYELTGIAGVRTTADVERVQTSLTKEREEHAITKAKLKPWSGMSHEEVIAKLDRIEELEAAAKGKIDETQIEAMVQKRVEATIRSKLAPVERARDEALTKVGELQKETEDWKGKDRRRVIRDSVRKAGIDAKLLPTALEDVEELSDRVFEVNEQGQTVTRDGVGVTPGVDPKTYFAEMQPRRPHWWPASQGGKSQGSGPNGVLGQKNPWSEEHWSVTEQGNAVKTLGMEKARALAESAGSRVGATSPTKKASSST